MRLGRTGAASEISLSPLGRGKPNPRTPDSTKSHHALGTRIAHQPPGMRHFMDVVIIASKSQLEAERMAEK
jgi:hypothetical protein